MESFLQLIFFVVIFYSISQGQGSSVKAPRITEHPTDVTVLKNDPATLRCGYTGSPQPEVVWYRDGEALEPRGHRILLPDGALFFLRVTQGRGRNGGDAGTYWCVVRNSAGIIRSRNATLTVAYLQPDFRLLPETTRAVLGETATLHCQSPRGQPEPEVTWRKNGQPMVWNDELAINKDRIHVRDNGDLVINNVALVDEGKYQCVAQNMAGTRESPVVSLSVHVRPRVSEPPKDVTAVVGEDAVFECSASGDPPPSLLWHRLNGTLPAGRARATESRSGLKIERVTLADAGQYVCEVENAVGTASSVAKLTVLAPPTWTIAPPSEIRADMGAPVAVNCTATGTPSPFVIWRREGILHNTSDSDENHRRWNVLANGTLSIQHINTADSGLVYCAAMNEGGAILSRLHLEVKTPDYAVPTYLKIGPANQTYPIRSSGLLQCQTENGTIQWMKNGMTLNGSDTRFVMLESGALQIHDLQFEDSGSYTCWTEENNVTAAWTALLTVQNPVNPSVTFTRAMSDPLALPGPPTQPVVSNRTLNTITISWQSSSRMGASPLVGYTVEAYNPEGVIPGSWVWGSHQESDKYWRIVARQLKANTYTFADLKAGTSLLVLVRAENSHGLSFPSPLSAWIRTVTITDMNQDLIQARDFLSGSLLKLERIIPINSTSVRFTWDIIDGESYIEGLYLFHINESVRNTEEIRPDNGPEILSTVINDPSSMTFTLSGLKPDTEYTFFLIPFYGIIEGRPSNTKTVRTLADVPSGYPQNLTVRQYNESSVLVQWKPPLPDEQNGIITAYQIYVYSEEMDLLLANLTLPASPTSIAVGGLEGGIKYALKSAAWTSAGLGPPSPAIEFTLQNLITSIVPVVEQEVASHGTMAQETWLIMLVGGTLVLLLLSVILVVVIKRRMKTKSGGDSRQANGGNSLLWPLSSQPWNQTESSKESQPQLGPDYAEVFPQCNPMTSFLRQPASAYASTTLVRNSSSLPYRYQSSGVSNPSDNSSYSFSNPSGRKVSQPIIPNWVELLPPPPSHPPPPLTASDRNLNADFSAQYLTCTLPSGIHTQINSPIYPLRPTINAQSHPTLISGQMRNSFRPQRNSAHRHNSKEDDLYASCIYDQIDHYPIPSYR